MHPIEINSVIITISTIVINIVRHFVSRMDKT